MVKLISRTGRRAGRLIAVAALTSLLASCGGGSGDTPLGGGADFDGDGTPDIEDFDADGDGILDAEDAFVDLDGDGFDDFTGETEELANAPDVEGDADNDGFIDVTADAVCGGENGSDNNSSNNDWSDNCVIRRGQFATSLYSVGIQRLLFCAAGNFASGTTSGTDYREFADGIYGPNTEAAVEAFQRTEEGLTVDGIVGPVTWGRLQNLVDREVEPLVLGVFGERPEGVGFTEGPCEGIVLFYRTLEGLTDDPIPVPIFGSWELARNAPNESQQIPFSIDRPSDLL